MRRAAWPRAVAGTGTPATNTPRGGRDHSWPAHRTYAEPMSLATRAGRLMTTVTDGARYLPLLAISGVATVLVVRAYLSVTGYPQVGGATLHIAHLLWGGLLMLAGLLCALLVAGGGARAATATLGGIGLGLFVDEVGKF